MQYPCTPSCDSTFGRAQVHADAATERRPRLLHVLVRLVLGTVVVTATLGIKVAEAVPAFARKYKVDCTVCHTRPPRLNTFGERYLENGYQMPGTEDGGLVEKIKLSNVTLDDVSNYFAVRIRGNFLRSFAMDSPANEADRTELAFPDIVNIFFAGTFTENLGGFIEIESNLEEEEMGTERAFLTFNNIGANLVGANTAHLRVGRIDPSAYSSFPTHRQQMLPVAPEIEDGAPFTAPDITRIPLVPHAFAAKFFGLFDGEGKAIPVLKPTLYNTPATVGVDIHGRPFGDWFLYQIGLTNGVAQEFGDTNDQKDIFAMVRVDSARSNMTSASASVFTYFGNNAAKTASGADVDWDRYGVSANFRWRMVDVYGAYVMDKIKNLPVAMAATFDATASGLTLEADTLATSKILLSVRYDQLDPGGVIAQRRSASFVGTQIKYYHRDNIAFFVRGDLNLREGEAHPLRALRSAVFLGFDMAF